MTDSQTLVITVTPDSEAPDLPLLPECPPHQFEAAWATPPDARDHDDTVPALYCRACGDVRPFRIPEDTMPGDDRMQL